jgi:hypothetical protein
MDEIKRYGALIVTIGAAFGVLYAGFGFVAEAQEVAEKIKSQEEIQETLTDIHAEQRAVQKALCAAGQLEPTVCLALGVPPGKESDDE